MDEHSDGSSSKDAERAQEVAGWLSVKPEDRIPSADDNKGLQGEREREQLI